MRKTSVTQLDGIARSYGFPPIITDNVHPSEEPGQLGLLGQLGQGDGVVAPIGKGELL